MDSVFAVGFSIYFGAELSFKTSIKNNGTFSQIILKQKLLNYLHDSVVKKRDYQANRAGVGGGGD